MSASARLALFVALLGLAGCRVETGPPSEAAADSTARVETPAPTPRSVPEPTPVAPAPAEPDTTATAPPAATTRTTATADVRPAAEAFEDLAEAATDGDARSLGRALSRVDEQFDALGTRPAGLDSLRQVARQAAARGDRTATALAAARAHRTLTQSLPAGDPVRVRGLALVLGIRAKAPLPEWRAIRTTARALATEHDAWTSASPAIRDAMAEAVAAVATGAQTQNAPLVGLGAAIAADLAGDVPQR